MNSISNSDTGEKLKTFSEIKMETSDYHSEQSEYGFQFIDDIDIGKEFKTEFYDIDQISDDSSKLSGSERDQCFDDIEIGEEFKTEHNTHDQAFEDYPKESDPKLIFCASCNKTWKYSAKCKGLCPSCKSVIKYKCKKCAKVYTALNTLRIHVKLYCNKNLRICCDHCSYKTNCKRSLWYHIQARHTARDPNANKCSRCNKTYSNHIYLKKHSKVCGQPSQSTKASSKRLSCDHCSYKTDRKCNLADHIHAKHLPSDYNRCSKCGKNYASLWLHSKACGNLQKHFCCDHCDYRSFQKVQLLAHMQTKHLPRERTKCEKCGKSYLQRQNLLNHIKLCGKTESSIRSLMKLSCEHCDYKTNAKAQLSEHMIAKHLKDPDLNKCERCGKSYKWTSDYRKHLKICGQKNPVKRSFKEKRFSCQRCSFKCPRKDYLVSHMQSKHSNKRYKCKACGVECSSEFNLARHSKNNCKRR